MPLFRRKSKTAPEAQTINESNKLERNIANSSAQPNNSQKALSLPEGQGRGAGATKYGQSHGELSSQAGQQAVETEGAVGAGSAALRELGLQKESEAQALYAQSQEIAEAERLEDEAKEHRERAVAAGAHPTYRELGSGGNELD